MSAAKTMVSRVAKAWRPRKEYRLSEFVAKHFYLSPETEASGGRFDLVENPYWRDILDYMQDPDVRQITVLKSTRVGGTLTMIAALWGLSELDPGPAMIVSSDKSDMITIKDRVYANGLECPMFKNRVPPETKRNDREVNLGTCKAFLAAARMVQRLRGKTCIRVFRSEVDIWPREVKGGNPLTASEERVKRSFYTLIYTESSPDGEDSVIDEMHKLGNQMTWQCPCPHCGHHQELRFFPHRSGPYAGCGGIIGYRDHKTGDLLSDKEIQEKTHYLCEKGCRIENHEKHGMVKAGRWVPKGCHIEDGELVGTPDMPPTHISIHLWQIVVPRIRFSDLAMDYAKHLRNRQLKEFKQNVLGLRYTSGVKPPKAVNVIKRYTDLTYNRGNVPTDVWFLTAGVDVQLRGIYWCVWGWGHMARSWLVDWGYIRRFMSQDELDADDEEDLTYPHLSSDLLQLSAPLINRRFSMQDGKENKYGRTDMRIKGIAIDCNFRSHAVHRYISRLKDNRVIAVRGDHQCRPDDKFRPRTVDRDRKGNKFSQKRELWGIYTTHYKDDWFDRFTLPPESESALSFPAEMHTDGQDFVARMRNERFDTEQNKWVLINKNLESHELDTSVYAYARAEIILTNLKLSWDTSTWQQQNRNGRPFLPNQQASREYQLN